MVILLIALIANQGVLLHGQLTGTSTVRRCKCRSQLAILFGAKRNKFSHVYIYIYNTIYTNIPLLATLLQGFSFKCQMPWRVWVVQSLTMLEGFRASYGGAY